MRWSPSARLWVSLLLGLLSAPALAASPATPTTPVATQLAAADRQYDAKSYAAALEGYRSLLASGVDLGDRRPELEYRYAVCLGKAERWDAATDEAEAFVKRHAGTIWEARGQYWRGRLLLAVPHQGYRVGDRLYRGENVPKTDSAEKPQPAWLAGEDLKESLAAMEAAKLAFQAARVRSQPSDPQREAHRGSRPSARGSSLSPEEIALNFDLARVLKGWPLGEWASPRKWLSARDPSWAIDPRGGYRPDWPAPKRILFLLREVQASADLHHAALGRLAEVLFLDQYHEIMRWHAQVFQGGHFRISPYPYQRVDADAILKSIVVDYPGDPIADQVHYTIGTRLSQRGEYLQALDVLRELVRTSPSSKWVTDAQSQIASIFRRTLSLDTGGPQPSGKRTHLTLSVRNIRRVTLRAYRVRLEDLVRAYVRNPDERLSELVPRFLARYWVWNQGKLVAEWKFVTHDRGDHRLVGETVRTLLDRPGAYVIVAQTPEITTRGLLLITDRVLVQKVNRDGALLFVADARTGAPQPDAHVLVREVYGAASSEPHTRTVEGQTNRDGLFEFAMKRREASSIKPWQRNESVEAIAWTGDQYAVTPQIVSYDSGERAGYKLYSYTDRPVYRPGQKVRFRQLVARQENGRLTPVPNRPVIVTVTDSRGNPVFEATLTSDAYGAVAGDFALPEEPPLGEYVVSAVLRGVGAEAIENGGNRFRVEEYRKPEFEVAVTADRAALRVGEPGRARLKARYYFGAPVPGARVVYHVYRSAAAPRYRFPRPFDFLYRYWDTGNYDYGAYRGDLVSSGEARTDAHGEASISFDTGVTDQRWNVPSMRYTVEAEVTDASRRTISGSGSVMATRQQFFTFLDTPQGFYARGDHVPVEVVTLDANEQPVSATGIIKVYRRQWKSDRSGTNGTGPGPLRLKETVVFQAPLKTDAAGQARMHWVADRSGDYRIAFEARDSWEAKVFGSVMAWVAGPGMNPSPFLQQGLQLVMENDTVPEGGRARVLLLADQPGATVLLTQEANDEILRREVIRLPENTQVIELPVNGRHTPNFYLQVTMVRDGKVHQVTQEIRVPSVRHLVDVKVAPDREKYRPGEKATFRLTAADWQGQPVRGAFSVGVVDSSLLAIQKEYAPDIRQYFYADRRSASIYYNASTEMSWEVDIKGEQPTPYYRLHPWVAPEGMGELADWPGENQLGFLGFGGGIYAFPLDNSLIVRGGGLGGFGGAMPGGLGGGLGGFGGGGLGGFAGGFAGPLRGLPASPRDETDALKQQQGAGLAPAAVRTSFADTAFWTPAVITDAHGEATVSFAWPDDLTTWRTTTRGWTADAQVGNASTEVVTHKDLLVRLQAPRFFVERDQVVLSANVHNYLSQAKRARVRLEIEGDELALDPDAAVKTASLASASSVPPAAPAERWIDVPKDGEARVDWAIRVRHEGTVKIRMTAQTDEESDAVELSFPVIVHGVEKLTVTNGALLDRSRASGAGRGGDSTTARFTIDVPKARKPGSTELNIQLTPSVAGTMLDALPYLADYPYGCIEQTMSRFLPSVVVAKTLQDLGLRLEDLEKRADAYAAERKTGGSPRVVNSPYTYPRGMPGSPNAAEEASTLWYWRLDHTPVFHTRMLREMVSAGLQRVIGAQTGDGGWGWWPGMVSDPYMSAYVLYGLQTARAAGWRVPDAVMTQAIQFVKHSFLEGDDLHLMAYEGSVLALDDSSRAEIRPLLSGRLFERRERLSPYSQALLATALYRVGASDPAKIVLANLENTAKVDEGNGTVHWEGSSGDWWRWYENKVETNAAVLQAILLIQPEHRFAPMLVKGLVNNRRGQHWSSTKETAMAVYALADYVRANRELSPEYTVTVDFDGRQRRTYQVSAANVLFFDNRFIVPDALIHEGMQTVTITKNGPGSLYYAAFLRTFTLEDNIRGTGNEIFVRRRYFRLLPEDPAKINADRAQELTPRYAESVPDIYRRVPLASGDELKSGDLIEVELLLESKNDYDYLVFEDLKPAGCEPVELRSGGRQENGLWAQMELRDQKVAFFLSELPQGTRTLTYRLRAETPGHFHALPTNGYAMYAPDIRTLSDEFRLGIQDR